MQLGGESDGAGAGEEVMELVNVVLLAEHVEHPMQADGGREHAAGVTGKSYTPCSPQQGKIGSTKQDRARGDAMRAKILLATAAAISLIVTSQLPAAADTSHALTDSSSQLEQVKTTRVTVPLETSQSLNDVLQITEARGYPVQSYRFENAEVVGEYSPKLGSSPEEYLAGFEERYGTQPQFVSVTIDVPVATAEKWYRERGSKAVSVRGNEFKAAPVNRTNTDRLLEQSRRYNQSSSSAVSAKALDWRPKNAEIQIVRSSSSTVYFSQYYYWDGTNSRAAWMDAGYGFEMEVNVITDSPTYASGLRAVCAGGYKEQPIAKNYGWTWEALVNAGAGVGPVSSAVGAYADYNDLSDPCNKNSMAIGFRSPNQLPSYPNGSQEVVVTIEAPRGVDNVNKIGGLVQSVNAGSCYVAPWMALTDCMGVSGGSVGSRTTLNEGRNWTAPNKCWRSFDYGTTDPLPYSC